MNSIRLVDASCGIEKRLNGIEYFVRFKSFTERAPLEHLWIEHISHTKQLNKSYDWASSNPPERAGLGYLEISIVKYELENNHHQLPTIGRVFSLVGLLILPLASMCETIRMVHNKLMIIMMQ